MINNRHRLRKLLRLFSAISIAFAMGTTVIVSQATVANAKCKTGRTNDGNYYHDGWYRNNAQSVYSDIYNYSPWVTTQDGDSAWTMLLNTVNHYAQVGWLESTGGVRETFVEWTYQGQVYQNFYNPQPVGSFSHYTTLWNNTPGKFTFQVAGSTVDTVNADFTPNQAQVSGEIKSLSNQMPGARNNHENFNDTHYYNSGWQNFNGSTFNSNGNYFYNQYVSATEDDIWDLYCQT